MFFKGENKIMAKQNQRPVKKQAQKKYNGYKKKKNNDWIIFVIAGILIALIIAGFFIFKNSEKKNSSSLSANQSAPQSTSSSQPAPLTTDYSVDFTEFSRDDVIAQVTKEAYDYYISVQPTADTNVIQEDLNLMSAYIKTVRNLGLDPTEHFKEILEAMGGDAAINDALSNGLPENYIKFILSYQACELSVTEYMRDNNLLIDGKEQFMSTYWRAKHVLVQTEGMTEEQKAEAKTKAENILARAQSGEDFDALVTEFSEDPGSKTNPEGYVFTTGTMVAEFENGTKNTPIGEFTMVETTYGYHVIQRLALDETPELYEKFYAQSGIESTLNEDTIKQFVLQNA